MSEETFDRVASETERSFSYAECRSCAGHHDAGPVRSVGPAEQPHVWRLEPVQVPGLRVAPITVHRLQHDREPGARGAGLRAELRQLLPDAGRVTQHPLLAAVRQSVPEFGERGTEGRRGQLQREARGGQTGQQRLETVLRSGSARSLVHERVGGAVGPLARASLRRPYAGKNADGGSRLTNESLSSGYRSPNSTVLLS